MQLPGLQPVLPYSCTAPRPGHSLKKAGKEAASGLLEHANNCGGRSFIISLGLLLGSQGHGQGAKREEGREAGGEEGRYNRLN